MEKLRDWWPSDEMLVDGYKRPSRVTNLHHDSERGRKPLRLAEVAAALNADNIHATGLTTTTDSPTITKSKPSTKSLPPPASSRKKIHGLHRTLSVHPINKDSFTRRETPAISSDQLRQRPRRELDMPNLFATLHSLLPQAATPRKDRCTVVTCAMDYIYKLQAQLEILGREKTEILVSREEHLHQELYCGLAANPSLITEISDEIKKEVLLAADVAVKFCGRDAFITLNSPKKKGMWSGILQVLQEQDMEPLNVSLSTSNETDYHCIHARISTASDLRSHELLKVLQDLILSHAILD